MNDRQDVNLPDVILKKGLRILFHFAREARFTDEGARLMMWRGAANLSVWTLRLLAA